MGDETRQVRETRWFSNRGLTRQAVRRRMSAELSVKLRKCLYKKQGHTATNNICRQNCSNWGNICTKKQSYSPQVNSCCILSLCTVNYLFRCQKDAESETTSRYQFQKTIRWNIITQSYSLHRRSPCFWEHFVHFVPYGSTLYIRNIYIYIVFILYYISHYMHALGNGLLGSVSQLVEPRRHTKIVRSWVSFSPKASQHSLMAIYTKESHSQISR